MSIVKKTFLITVDTEGDNQWEIYRGGKVNTNNARYIPRFQALCEKYNFKPVYLVNYEMITDDYLAAYLKEKVEQNLCEVGTHVHAWNSPPNFDLVDKYHFNPYITEYPDSVIYEKLLFLTNLIEEKIGIRPVSHRAGRWASSDALFAILAKLGYVVDCSIVSGWNMTNYPGKTVAKGFDYSNYPDDVYSVCGSLKEVPMSVHFSHTIDGKNTKNRIRNFLLGKYVWLRPAVATLKEMKNHIDNRVALDKDYAMFMIHSTELMPKGSPYYKTISDIERQYHDIEALFTYVREKEFEGALLKEFILKYDKF